MEELNEDKPAIDESSESVESPEPVDPWAPPPHDPTKTYGGVHARVEDGMVREIFEQPDDGFAMEDRFAPECRWVEITSLSPRPSEYWTAEQDTDGVWHFAPPDQE